MSSPTVRGAIIGGIVGVVLHLIFRFILANLVWLALAIMLLWVLAKCSPENPKDVSKRAHPQQLRSAVHRGLEMSEDFQPPTQPTSKQFRQPFRTMARHESTIYGCIVYSSPQHPTARPQRKHPGTSTVSTPAIHYGYISPGAIVSVRLIPEANWLLEGS